LLEKLTATLRRLAGGFRDVRTNLANGIEETSRTSVALGSTLAFVAGRMQELVEVCRPKEFDVFVMKMARHHGECHVDRWWRRVACQIHSAKRPPAFESGSGI